MSPYKIYYLSFLCAAFCLGLTVFDFATAHHFSVCMASCSVGNFFAGVACLQKYRQLQRLQ